jgi:glycosyltransferase involved in cell wall biosynthesis
MHYPLISIVVPVYNGSNFLEEAINSALAQDYPNFEIVVVNDGSNDAGATREIARRFGSEIRYFEKENGGVASALNFGIAEMKGDYFSWLSHDDLYSKDKLRAEYEALMKLENRESIIYSNYEEFSVNHNDSRPVKMKGVQSQDFRYWLVTTSMLHGCTLLIPAQAFAKVGNFREELRTTQDYDLWFRLSYEFDFVHLDLELVKFRIHADQDSNRIANLALRECNDLYTRFVLSLTTEELIRATNEVPRIGYQFIIETLYRRGWHDAAKRVAEELGIQQKRRFLFSKLLEHVMKLMGK